MGAIAEAITEYARPLIDASDGSHEGVSSALAIAQICWNLAILAEDKREDLLVKLRPALPVAEEEFEEFRQTVLTPMIRRHEEMFPGLHGHAMEPLSVFESDRDPGPAPEPSRLLPKSAHRGKYPGTGRYDPCPCGSGEKYKFCCERS